MKKHATCWVCLCDCGNIIIVRSRELIAQKTKSCGCLKKEVISKIKSKRNKYNLSGEYGIGWTTNTNREFYFDLEDYDLIKDYCWCENNGYAFCSVNKKGNKHSLMMHRLVLHNKYDLIDHINCNKLDNRKKNLRPANKQLNDINRSCNKNNKLGIKGVSENKNGYLARIKKDGKNIYIGWFKSLEEAKRARQEKEIELYGEFARVED